MTTAQLVGVVISEHCATHNFGTLSDTDGKSLEIFDRPDRVGPLLQQLRTAGGHHSSNGAVEQVLVQSQRSANDVELTRMGVTSASYLDTLKHHKQALSTVEAKRANGTDMTTEPWEFLDKDESTLVTAKTEMAARSAVGAALEATERVFEKSWAHAFVCSRPPGHHNGCCELLEELDEGGHIYACHGGCVLNETAVAIRHVQHLAAEQMGTAPAQHGSAPGTYKVAVVDVDVHFGDGTALNFYDDPSVLHISLHLDQSDRSVFPFLVGKPEERGIGPGLGTTVNLPLPEGADDRLAWQLFDKCGGPRLRAFAPNLIFLGCGFDGLADDPAEAVRNPIVSVPSQSCLVQSSINEALSHVTHLLISTDYCFDCCHTGVMHRTMFKGVRLTPQWFQRVAAACKAEAPVVAVLQGGYLPYGVAEAAQFVLAGLCGDTVGFVSSTGSSPDHEEVVPEGGIFAAEYIEAVEARLDDRAAWWDIDTSFDHGLQDLDEHED
eukprot:SAG31_NODE_340_length_17466_cov_5.689987_8_plen_494_part_00